MYTVGMDLVRSLQPWDILLFFWDILLIYCNNQLKKVYSSLAEPSEGGTLHPPFWCLCQKLPVCFHAWIKPCYTKALEWSSLVPRPEAKSSFLEIMNMTPFTVSCQGYVLQNTWPVFFSRVKLMKNKEALKKYHRL